MKQFHVYGDRKTVKELSLKDYMKMMNQKRFIVGWMTDSEILFVKGGSAIHLSLEQLRKILELNKEEVKP